MPGIYYTSKTRYAAKNKCFTVISSWFVCGIVWQNNCMTVDASELSGNEESSHKIVSCAALNLVTEQKLG